MYLLPSTAYYLPIKHFPKQALQPPRRDLIYFPDSTSMRGVVAFPGIFGCFPPLPNEIVILLLEPHPGVIFMPFLQLFNGLDQEYIQGCAIGRMLGIIICMEVCRCVTETN